MYHPIYSSAWTLSTLLILLSGTLVATIPLTWPTIPLFDPDNDAFVLPESITPTQYIVSLVPDIKSKKFHGEVDILGQTDDTGSEVSRVVLNADDLRVKSVQLVDLTDGASKVEIKHFVMKRIPQWLVVTPVSNLSANSDYQLRIKFEGNFGIEAGMYHASYDDDYTKIGGDVALTEFQTTYARKVFPCWDEPKYKASFIMKVARYPDQISLSNMPLQSTSVADPHEDNRVWDTFDESPDMSTYLVAMVVAQLVSVHDPVHNLSIWTQPGKQEGAHYALDLTGQLMDRMEEFTGIPYTLPKLDQVALPKLRHQAMEHWGVIAFSERFLVVDDMASLKQKQQVAFHISHELAHQWFGNLVTMEWWNYVWLNEGFAEFFQYFLLDMLEPDWRLMEIFVVNEVQSMLTHDSFLFTHPVTMKKVRTVVDIEKVFDSVSYCKGGAMVRMLYHIMTPGLFQKAIRDYLQQNSLKSVTEDDLWDSLGSVQTELELDLPTDIAEIMYFWTHEPGYPLLMVERDEDGSINLTQKRFLMTNSTGSDQSSSKGPRWWIPLSYTTSTELDFNDTRPREWFNVSNAFHQVEINLDDDEWILFNIQLAGYYRVNYDPHTWSLLIDDLVNCQFLDIHPLNRAQLLDDAFTLSSAGYLNYATALNLSRYLAHETDIIPWTTAFDIFKTLEAKLIGTPARPLFRRYIQMLVSNWYSSINFDGEEMSADGGAGAGAKTPNCATKQLTRMTVVALACGFGHHGCVDRALKQVYLLMSEAETEIPTDLEDILLCTAVNAGPEEVWQFVRKQYMSSTSRKKRESYLEAMACSQDPNKIMQMLEDSLDVKSEFFKNSEGNTLIGALVRRKTNSETMLNFFYKNAQEISALYGPEDLQNYFMFATLHMNPIQIDELHSFMEGKMKQLNLTGIHKVFSIEKYISTMKQAEVNTWYASYYHDIYRWLQDENETLETSTKNKDETDGTLATTYSPSTSTESTTTIYSTKMSTFDYVTEDSIYPEPTTDHGMSGGGEGAIDYDDENDDEDDDDSEDDDDNHDIEVVDESENKIEKMETDKIGKKMSASASGLSLFKVVTFIPVLCIVVFR